MILQPETLLQKQCNWIYLKCCQSWTFVSNQPSGYLWLAYQLIRVSNKLYPYMYPAQGIAWGSFITMKNEFKQFVAFIVWDCTTNHCEWFFIWFHLSWQTCLHDPASFLTHGLRLLKPFSSQAHSCWKILTCLAFCKLLLAVPQPQCIFAHIKMPR